MPEKLPVIVVYAISGVLLALWPVFSSNDKKQFDCLGTHLIPSLGKRNWIFEIVLLLILCWISTRFITIPSLSVYLAGLIIISAATALHNGRLDFVKACGVLTGLFVTLTLAWWQFENDTRVALTIPRLFLFVLTTSGFLRLYNPDSPDLDSPAHTSRHRLNVTLTQCAAFMFLAAGLSFETNIFGDSYALGMAWHHWSAYIGSSELLLAGAKIFYDFPAQYGFGPTALIASLCGNTCWPSMYFISGILTFLFALSIAGIALNIRKMMAHELTLVLLLCLICCFFWSAYPPQIMSPIVTPSVSGLRFFPVVVLVLVLIRIDRHENSENFPFLIGHIFWCLASLWSVESAFYATFVWWPYYILLRSSRYDSTWLRIAILLRLLNTLLGILLVVVLCVLTLYWLFYRCLPDISAFLAYALNPPGTMPINARGSIWYLLFTMAMGTASNWLEFKRSGNSIRFRKGYLILLLAFATSSYYLGRSHDNNIINLLPFFLLVLLSVRTEGMHSLLRPIPSVMLAGIIGCSSFFGWHSWNSIFNSRNSITFGPDFIMKSDSDDNKSVRLFGGISNKYYSSDAIHAMMHINEFYKEPTTILHSGLSNLNSPASDYVWSAIHGPDNYTFISFQYRQKFLARTAKTLSRTGWLIIENAYNATNWLKDFDSAYSRVQEIQYGTYHAIRFTPISD